MAGKQRLSQHAENLRYSTPTICDMRARPNEVDLTLWSSTLCEPKLLLHLLDVLDRSQSTADTAASVQTASKWWENNG